MSMIAYPAVFNGTDLTSVPGLTVLRTDPYHPARRDVSISELVHTNKSKINSAHYTEKAIAVRVGISRATRPLLEQSIDTLMRILQPVDKPLLLKQGVDWRKYFCTYSDAIIDRQTEGGSYIEMDLVFLCSDRHGYDLTETTLLTISTGYTSAQRSDGLTFQGSALWQAPVISLTYSSITGGTSKEVKVGNSATGQEISITRTWTSGDQLVVDSLNKSVRVNGVDVNFTGAFPEWAPEFGYWYYEDAFTARTFTGNIRCAFRYI